MDRAQLSTSLETTSSAHWEGNGKGNRPPVKLWEDNEEEPYVKRRLYTEEVLLMWNIAKLVRDLGTKNQCVAFAESQGLIPITKMCRVHRTPMSLSINGSHHLGYFTCRKGTCKNDQRITISRALGTWFENVKISMVHVFYLMYCFAHLKPYEEVIWEDVDRKDKCLSRRTISVWYNYCRETIVIYQLSKQDNKGKIGGPGKVVQINESKFGKRKYNKGRRIDGHWVLGMIEDGSEDLRLEVCPDNLRTANVLVPLIIKHVADGSIVHTDCSTAYDGLGEQGYTHKKINHSDPDHPFVTPDGVHTQKIGSQWRVVKAFFNKKNHPMNFGGTIVEYMWRHDVKKCKGDPFVELIKAIKEVYTI